MIIRQRPLEVARSERNAFLEQRDQAYGEVDDLCRERAQLKAKVERLKGHLETSRGAQAELESHCHRKGAPLNHGAQFSLQMTRRFQPSATFARRRLGNVF
jgi:chromosome segregation ATPase